MDRLGPKVEVIRCATPTQAHTAVLQQVTQMLKHGLLILPANSTEIAKEATAASNHFGEGNLWGEAGSIREKNLS